VISEEDFTYSGYNFIIISPTEYDLASYHQNLFLALEWGATSIL
jgi:hypothetical protein